MHFTLTEKGTQAGRAGTQGEAVITGQQIRAARGILAWDRRDLARKAIVTIYTVERIERGTGISDAAKAKGLTAIKTALEVILPSFFEGKSVIHGSRAWLPSHAGNEDDDDIRDARPIRNYRKHDHSQADRNILHPSSKGLALWDTKATATR